ncbi:MAG: hypothetical protein ACRENA_04230 [Vulcanimicrobiaceae bacterium]
MRRVAAIHGSVLAFALIATALPSSAAGGLAWDQVTKFSMDGSIPEPNFQQDFETASQSAQDQPQHHGMFGGIQNSINAAMGGLQMMQRGIAEHHYVAGSFMRVDNVAEQTAVIVDCAARTMTYLNLAKKTYRVASLDQPPPPSSGKPGSGPQQEVRPEKDDGTRYKVAYNSQALGAKKIGGLNTDGYKADMSITVMRPNTDPQTMTTNLTEYVSSYAEPHQSCPPIYVGMAPGGGGGGRGPMATVQMTHIINAAMRTPGGDPRFTFSATGPSLPAGRLDMFSVYQFMGQGGGRGFATILERGNVHQINDGDKSLFGVPPDFTKET